MLFAVLLISYVIVFFPETITKPGKISKGIKAVSRELLTIKVPLYLL